MNVPGGQFKRLTMQNAVTATGDGTSVAVTDASGGAYSVLAMQITGITTATITFEASIDDSNWVGILAENVTTGAEGATATENGIYRITALGMVSVRARVSAYTSGTITVVGLCIP